MAAGKCGPALTLVRLAGASPHPPIPAAPMGTSAEGPGPGIPPATAEGDEPVPARYTGQNDRSDAHSVRHRARGPARRGKTLAASLRRVAQARGTTTRQREARTDAATDGPGA